MLVGQKVGPFAIEKELGSGAMGSVYRARYIPDNRIVALKVIAFGLAGNDSAMKRFTRESGILQQLRHPNIVRLFATGRWRETPFFAMEYIDGESLDRVMARRDRFTWQEVIDIGKQLCSALQHAHDKGIIHRDLKPSNLMVTRDGAVKLTDFGIAKDVDVTALTGAHNTIGTAAYMSPEQCKGEKSLTGKSDLYSLGVVFFELLTGQKPFVAESSVDMFLMHVNTMAPRVRNRPACLDVPQGLDTLIHQLMEKKPEHRPRDPTMVAQALEEIEQKEIARMGRGEEVAKARIIDRVETAPIDETDKEAAKTIRAGTKKSKKSKKKKAVFYRQGWFALAGSILLLAGLGGIAWLLLKPDSPDEMIAAIDAAKTPEAKLAAAKLYLDAYGKKNNPKLAEKTERVKSIYWDAKVAKRESQLLNRHHNAGFRNKVEEGDDAEAYRKTMNALTDEDEGNVAAARSGWKALVEQYQNDANEEKALWGWVAAKRLKDLDEVDVREKQVQDRITDASYNDREFTVDDPAEAAATEAFRLQKFGDPARACERWKRTAKDLKDKSGERSWYLLAGKKWRELEANRMTNEERKSHIQERLAKAASDFSAGAQANDRILARTARNLCRDIRDLYAADELFKEEVSKARELLDKNPRS
jgi:predicted Ser/Thr protein kinase